MKTEIGRNECVLILKNPQERVQFDLKKNRRDALFETPRYAKLKRLARERVPTQKNARGRGFGMPRRLVLACKHMPVVILLHDVACHVVAVAR